MKKILISFVVLATLMTVDLQAQSQEAMPMIIQPQTFDIKLSVTFRNVTMIKLIGLIWDHALPICAEVMPSNLSAYMKASDDMEWKALIEDKE